MRDGPGPGQGTPVLAGPRASTTRGRWWTRGVLVGVQLLALSCAPYLSNTHPEIRALPFAWQCPTISPMPTQILGYLPTTLPRGSAEPLYSTPVPTVTPYIRTGADFFQGQRVAIGPLIVAATLIDQSVRVTLENRTTAPVELHLTLSVVRTVRRADGQLVEGSWTPAEDGPGLLAPGTTTTVDLTFRDLPGTPQEWGMPFIGDDQRRSGPTGNGYAWWRFQGDPLCAGQAGGPPSDPYDLPVTGAAPAVGRVGWPVPAGTVITRGYGCARYWTGVRGASCPANAPWWHNGIDFAGDAGTPVFAVTTMTIQSAGSVGDCAGTFVRGQDADGAAYDYYHLQSIAPAVHSGSQVAARTVLAQMGATGCATGPHLHLTVRAPDGREINPFNVLQP